MFLDIKNKIVAGVDEVGYGPLAGPVIAAAVILPARKWLPGVKDSKLLSAKQREELFVLISAKAIAISIGRASVEEIDQLNIYHATMLAMQRAVSGLQVAPELVLVDGRSIPKLEFETKAIVDGDKKIKAISAASIIAKVTRDREMKELDAIYPIYNFAKHKGYSTKEHKALLFQYGPCPIHRNTFCNNLFSGEDKP